MNIKTHYNAQEIADMRLIRMPKTANNVRSKAERQEWKKRKRKGNGGGYEYAFASLPADVQEEIRERCMQALLADAAPRSLPAVATAQTPRRSLTKAQLDCESARLGVLLEIDRLIAETGCTQHAAMQAVRLNAMTRNPAHDGLRRLMTLATDNRGGKDRVPAARTIARWMARRESQTLAPMIREPDMSVPEWGGGLSRPLPVTLKTQRPRRLRAVYRALGWRRAAEHPRGAAVFGQDRGGQSATRPSR